MTSIWVIKGSLGISWSCFFLLIFASSSFPPPPKKKHTHTHTHTDKHTHIEPSHLRNKNIDFVEIFSAPAQRRLVYVNMTSFHNGGFLRCQGVRSYKEPDTISQGSHGKYDSNQTMSPRWFCVFVTFLGWWVKTWPELKGCFLRDQPN